MAGEVVPMDVRLLAAISGELDDLNVAALCRERGVSRKTFYKWRARFEAEGLAGLEERSRRPHRSPERTPDRVEDLIIELRKWLLGSGLDAGPATIRYHLRSRGISVLPSEATIWRILVRRGFVVPEPKKRPGRTYKRFEASFPNECWQIDATEWPLLSGRKVALINVIDDHSRLAVACRVVRSATTQEAWNAFASASERWGLPVRCLSDNGLAFSGKLHNAEVYFETQLKAAGITPITSRPFHPQTCGKVERFQQTLKRWLRARPPASDLWGLQTQVDEFRSYYNRVRPHRATGRIPPLERWAATPALSSPGDPIKTPNRRVRFVDSHGRFTVLGSQVHLGIHLAGQEILVVLDGTCVAVFHEGLLVRHLELDRSRRYQPSRVRPGRKRKDGT
jgi:transposase InsO family protein